MTATEYRSTAYNITGKQWPAVIKITLCTNMLPKTGYNLQDNKLNYGFHIHTQYYATRDAKYS